MPTIVSLKKSAKQDIKVNNTDKRRADGAGLREEQQGNQQKKGGNEI